MKKLGKMAEPAKRKLAEKHKQSGEKKISDILESIRDGFFALDHEWRFTYVNRRSAEYLGLEPEALLGQNAWEKFPQIVGTCHEFFNRKAMEKREVQRYEMKGVLTDKWFSINVYPSEEGISIYWQDITDRKKAEEERARLIAIMESTSDLVAVTKPDGQGVYMNAAGRRMLGVPEDEDVRKSTLADAHPPWASRIVLEEGIPKAIECGTWKGETALLARDGREIPVSQVIMMHYSANGNPEFISTIMRDITERKQAEEALRISENKYRKLYESMRDAFVSVDMDGRIKECNQAYLAMLGYSPEEIGKLTYRDVTPERWHEMEERIVRTQILTKGFSGVYEKEYRKKDGTVFPVELRTVLIRDDAGTPVRMWAVVRDVTDRKTMEKELFSKNDALSEQTEKLAAVNEEMKRSISRFELLAQTSSNLLQAPNPQKIIDSLCHKVMEYLDCHAFFNFIADESAGMLHLNAYAGIPEEEARKIEWLDFGVAVCGCSARDSVRIVAENILSTADERTDLGRSYGIRAYASYLLVGDGGRTIGTLSFGTRSRDTFSETDLSLMKAVADQVTTALIRMRTETEVRNHRDKLEALVKKRTAKLEEINSALQESEAKYRFLTEKMSDTIWITDKDLNVTFISPSIERIRGYTPEEVMGQKVTEYLTPHSCARAMELLNTELERIQVDEVDPEKTFNIELEFYCKDGSTAWMESVITEIFDDSGNFVGIHGVGRDITERKKAEEEKKKLETQLMHIQKIEALDRFAGGIAHDLNNILYPIIVNTEQLLAEAEPDTSQYEMLDQSLKASYRQRDLIKKILTFSRKSEKKFVPVRIVPLLVETIGLLRSSLPITTQIHYDGDAETDVVMGDPTHIQQIVMNLCQNAADSLESQKGTIEIRLSNIRLESMQGHPDVQAGEYLKLEVKDSGHGMSREVMDRVFEPFYSTKGIKGTGMGLSVVHGIVRNLKGVITMESSVGKGSLFTVYLPVCHEECRAHTGTDDGSVLVRGREKILLVDDEEFILSSLKRALVMSGYEVAAFKDGKEALKAFSKKPDGYDLVITDLTMPEMSGVELARRLMNIRADIPVVLCTGFNDILSREEARSFGIRELLLKPAGTREIRDAIRRALET